MRNNDPSGHCENFLDCIKPDTWVLSLSLAFSFPGPEYVDAINDDSNPGAVLQPWTYSQDYEILSLDFVETTGEETQVFVTSASGSDDDSSKSWTDIPGIVTPQISITVEGMALWGDKFKEEGSNAYGGDADNFSISAGGFTGGLISAPNAWAGVVFGVNGGFPAASYQHYKSVSSRNPEKQKIYDTMDDRRSLVDELFSEFGSRVINHYGWSIE